MPRNRSQGLKVNWSHSDLTRAFQLVDEGTPIRQAARYTGVPFSTLQERLKSRNSDSPSLGRNPVFTKEQEADMANQIKFLGKIFYGCTSIQIRKMAYEFAIKNNLKHTFNEDHKMAGKDWLKGFMKRNNLSVRKAEGTSLNRATAFNKDEVNIFFTLLGELMDKYNFLPRNIYNVDETGITTVPEPGKIITETGQKRVGSITSGERGRNVTVVCAVSATGVYLPPMFIYPRQRHSPALENDGPRGAIYRCSKNGWINEDLFLEWLKHFATLTKPSESDPILLILDNHCSHISLKAYEFCKINNITMLSLPPHGSHRIQPLDVSIFGPFKAAYKQECNLLMKSELKRTIGQNDVASLFRKAFQKIATIPKAEAGFAATGIYPLNPDIFTEEDFLAAEVLNNCESVTVEDRRRLDDKTPDQFIPLTTDIYRPAPISPTVEDRRRLDNKTPDQVIPLASDIYRAAPNSPSILEDPVHKAPTKSPQILEAITHFLPSTSSVSSNNTFHQKSTAYTDLVTSTVTSTQYVQSPVPSTSGVTVKDLLPVPKNLEMNKKSSRRQHAKILTSTPYKATLIEKEERRATREKKKESKSKETKKNPGKKTAKKRSATVPIRKVKKRVLQEKNNESSSNSEIEMTDVRDDDDTDIDDMENKCLLCHDYGRNNELWYRCVRCGLWAHAECSGCESPEGYTCDLCR